VTAFGCTTNTRVIRPHSNSKKRPDFQVRDTSDDPGVTSSGKLVRHQDRTRHLQSSRRLKMARSAHAYVRGSTVKFYEWLESHSSSNIPQGPAVWICGDCHAHNLGPVANSDGHIEIQIRDLDQTVIGNPAHDLIRLGLSLATAARGSDLPGVATAGMLEQMLKGYTAAFAGRKARHQTAPMSVQRLLADATARKWKHLAEERIAGATASIPRGKRFWSLNKPEGKAVAVLIGSEHVRHLLTRQHARDDNASVELLDAAYWMKGCSSLGLLRYAALAQVGKKNAAMLCLIDIKEAVTAAAPRYADQSMPRDNAMRIVEGARHLSPYLGERMLAARLLDKGVFVREMFPQDLKMDLTGLGLDEAAGVARYLGAVVGEAHARQLEPDDRRAWSKELARNRVKSLDTPTWLWRCVVELVMTHEAAYLEHCRRYALDVALMPKRRAGRADLASVKKRAEPSS
jgi:uncharacterized protein (DUF2252 family)